MPISLSTFVSSALAGAVGSTGPTGATGITGASGVGATGPQGEVGATGIQGASGSTGLTGSTGPQGETGATGVQGVQGIQGVEGASGSTGLTGATGTQGETGSTGPQGASGATGIQGASGLQGSFGGAAFDYTYMGATGVASNPGTGKITLNNATISSATEMYINDTDDLSVSIYNYLQTIDDSTSAIKGHFSITEKTDTTNFVLFAITGTHTHGSSYFTVPISYLSGGGTLSTNDDVIITFARTGDKGDTGLTGASGPSGADGATGATGVQGASGVGASGAQGLAGATGPQGVQGIQGEQGASGVNGATGGVAATGATGYVGALYATNQVIIGATSWSSFASPLGATGSLIVAGPMAATNHITTPQLLVGNYGYTGLGATGATGMIIANQLKLVSGGAGSNITFSDGTTLASGTPSGYINGPISGFQLAIGATGNMQPTGATGTAWFGNQIYVGPQGSTGPQWGATGTVTTTNVISYGAMHVGTWGATSALGATGEIRATNNVTAYYASDRTLKENIRDIPSALEKVMKIGGKLYDWTDDYIKAHGGEDAYFLRKSDFGVIAQDVQEVFPVAIRIREDGTLAVDYEKLCALAFAAIKELNDKIDNK